MPLLGTIDEEAAALTTGGGASAVGVQADARRIAATTNAKRIDMPYFFSAAPTERNAISA
jgi:hypothetical protein